MALEVEPGRQHHLDFLMIDLASPEKKIELYSMQIKCKRTIELRKQYILMNIYLNYFTKYRNIFKLCDSLSIISKTFNESNKNTIPMITTVIIINNND